MAAPQPTRRGPLAGLRVLELAGIGPGPFCAMLLADQGATVLRIDRPGAASAHPEREFLNRGRRSAVLDLKHPRAVDALLRLADAADDPAAVQGSDELGRLGCPDHLPGVLPGTRGRSLPCGTGHGTSWRWMPGGR